jgi:C4-dicarboxylate-specific signal transduction histidine kinase
MADTSLKKDCMKPEAAGRSAGASLMDSAASDGLRFFGRMSASISHELKNTLSIMNESAGLIEDLALLAERGKALDASRMKSLGATIKRQIQRTDQIIRNMNRFSHSVDEPFKEIDLVDFLEFILTVSRRLTSAKGVAVAVHSRGQPIRVVTRPFFLHGLLWRLIEFGMQWVGTSKELIVSTEPGEPGVAIRFSGLEMIVPEAGRSFPAAPEFALLALLEAQLRIDFEEKVMILGMPQRIGSGLPG